MKPTAALASLSLCALTASPCAAQVSAAAFAAPVEAVASRDRGEPEVRRLIVEDDGAKIEELRVRGQTQRIVVSPKVGVVKPYEIITGNPGQDPFDGTGGARSAVGKRVWNVLAF